MKDEKLYAKAITWAEKHGLLNIKANTEDYETPAQYTRPGEDEPFIPDLTGLKRGGKYYAEIVTKEADNRRTVSKWKLLSTLAAMKEGKLFILAPRGCKALAQRLIEQNNIYATVVSI